MSERTVRARRLWCFMLRLNGDNLLAAVQTEDKKFKHYKKKFGENNKHKQK